MTPTYISRSHGKTISRTVSQVSRLVYMTFTYYINISHGKTISRPVSQVLRIVYLTFTYISRSHSKTSLIVP